MNRIPKFVLVLLVLCVAPVMAQNGDCPAIVQSVLASLDAICANTERNQACYGNLAMDVQPRPDAAEFRFEQAGDIEEVAEIQSIRMSPLDTDNNVWGVALMKLQASLPDTLPGQNVTFLLFGDVEIINAVPADSTQANPMQAFYLRTGVGEPGCEEAPQNGLMVQTPEGRGEVTFSVNGVDMALGSTVFFEAVPGQNMNISTLKGSAAMRVGDLVTPIVEGTWVNVPIGEDLLPADIPSLPLSYTEQRFAALPVSLLEDVIDIADPLTDGELTQLYDLIEGNLPVCGAFDFLPSCEDLPFSLGGDLCGLADDGETFTCGLPEFTWSDDVLLGTYDELAIWAESWTPDFWEEWEGLPDFGGLIVEGDMLFDEDGHLIGMLDALGDYEFFEDLLVDEEGNPIGVIGEDGEELFFEDILPEDLLDEFELPEDFGDGFELPGIPGDIVPGVIGGDDDDESAIEEALPPGCSPGICLADPAEACQCVLCGVQCPADDEGTGETSDDPSDDFGGDDLPDDDYEEEPPDDSD